MMSLSISCGRRPVLPGRCCGSVLFRKCVVLLHDLDVYWILCGVPIHSTHLRNCLALAQIFLRCASTPLLFTVSRITSHLRLGLGNIGDVSVLSITRHLRPEISGMRNSYSQEARCYGKIDLFFFICYSVHDYGEIRLGCTICF